MLFGEVGVAYATAIITLLIVIFAAVLPKTYALAYADRVALFVAPIMRGIICILTPDHGGHRIHRAPDPEVDAEQADDEANILAAHEEIRGTIELQTKEGLRGQGRRRTCSAACSICAICRSPTSWSIAPRWRPSTPTIRRKDSR